MSDVPLLPWSFSSDTCPVLYHYTSIDAARAIVESRTLRLTEHTAMNDASEFAYARGRLLDLIRKHEVYTDLTTRLHIAAALEGLSANIALLIGSLTARRDDLGQWRSYASNGSGCVLGIDAQYLEHDAGVHAHTVLYDEAEVDVALGAGLTVLQEQFEDEPNDHETLSHYARRLAADLFSMKHPCFADEREVRMSRMLYRDETGQLNDPGGNRTGGGETPALLVEERGTAFGPARFVALPLVRDDASSAIVSVGFGPTMSAEVASANRDMFESHGLEVWRSTLPYRA